MNFPKYANYPHTAPQESELLFGLVIKEYCQIIYPICPIMACIILIFLFYNKYFG